MTAGAQLRGNGGKGVPQRMERDPLGPRQHDGRIKGRDVRAGRCVRDQWVARVICEVHRYHVPRGIAEHSDAVPLLTMCARKS